MNTNSNWLLPACLVGASVFGVTQVLMKRQGTMAEAVAEVTSGEAEPVEPPEDDETQPPAPRAAVPPPKKQPEAPKVVRTPPRSWAMPSRPVGGSEKNDYDVIELAVNEDGTRILTKCKREVHYLELATGRILQTFAAPKRRYDYLKPDTEFLFLSPDAGFVATCSESHFSADTDDTSIAVQAAATGRTVAKLKLPDDTDVFRVAAAAGFTASGEALLLPQHVNGELRFLAVSTRDGAGKAVRLPNGKKLESHLRGVVPVPNEPVLMVYRDSERTHENPSGVCALDLRTGVETPLTSLDVDPWWLLYDRGLKVSPDGRLVLVQHVGRIRVIDWRANRRVFETSTPKYAYTLPHFTPDGRRFLVQKTPQFESLRIGGPPGGTRTKVPVTWELYDVASQGRIAEYEPVERAAALAVSGDGKTIVYSHGTKVYAIDFRSAFGVNPLPPVQRPDPARELPGD